MSSRSAHLEQARANRDLARHLLEITEDDLSVVACQWAVTTAFYASVHCIEAHLAEHGLTSASHRDRAAKMSAVGVPDEVYTAHEQLQQLSLQSRYLLRHFQHEYVRDIVLDGHLAIVATFAGLGDLPEQLVFTPTPQP